MDNMTDNLSTPTNIRRIALSLLFILGVTGFVFALWRQHSDLAHIREENKLLREQVQSALHVNDAIEVGREVLNRSESGLPTMETSLNEATSSSPMVPAETGGQQSNPPISVPELVLTPTGSAPNPNAEGLALVDTRLSMDERGLQATLRFDPTISEPLGIIAVVVRLPKNSESRILEMKLSGEANFSDVSSRISPDGKFAVYQGTPDNTESISVELLVSDSVVADVRGTSGIGPLDLTITADGVSVLSK